MRKDVLVLGGAGLLMGAAYAGMACLGRLGEAIVPTLILLGIASAGYIAAVWWVLRAPAWRRTAPLVVGLALLFRLLLLFTTPPSLSDDVYRYIWDGQLAREGVNPYAHPVDSAALDPYDTPQRALVNHPWMASPYLPVAQAMFWVVTRIAPGSALAFQVAAVLLDLLVGLIVVDILRRLKRPRAWALIYLWSPLVIVEYAHGAHGDALMIALVMAALWALVALRGAKAETLSAAALAAATLTKGLPALLLPALAPRWKGRTVALYAGLLIATSLPFALGAGWGLGGALDGRGLFGAIRIYTAYWNFNGGLYHWLEVVLSGYRTPGPVPVEIGRGVPVYAAKAIALVGIGGVGFAVWRRARRAADTLSTLRLAAALLGAYLLLATTVHPWYVTMVVPLLPFLPDAPGLLGRHGRYLWPGLAFSIAVPLSYLSYLGPTPAESALVRALEYVPLYLLLVWAAWPTIVDAARPAIARYRKQRQRR